MKNLKHLLFIVLCLCCITASAFEVDGIAYTITTSSGSSDYTVSVTSKSTKYEGNITIPLSVTYDGVAYRVTGIDNSAFSGCSSLRRVSLPTSVTSIGSSAFYSCSNLTMIEIPSGVTSIGNNAFSNCSNLTTVVNKSSLSISVGSTSNGYVGYYASYVVSTISSYNGYKYINYNSNYYIVDYTGLEQELSLPTFLNGSSISKYYIGDHAFFVNNNITSISIPASVYGIGKKAFMGCVNLKQLTIGTNVTNIGKSAFGNCYSLECIYYNAKSVSELSSDNYIFERAGDKSSKGIIVNFGNSVTSIPQYLFGSSYNVSGRPKITGVCISSSVTSIGSNAFYQCVNLKTVINNSSLSLTSGSSNYGYIACYTDKVYTGGTILNYGDYRFVYSGGTYYLTSYFGDDSDFVLPNDYNGNLYEIGAGAFSGNLIIRTVTIPNTITTIGTKAFYNCPNLASVTIGTNVKSIGDYAFYTGSNLSKVYLLPSEVPAGIDKAFSAITYSSSTHYDGTFITFVPNSNYTSTKLGTKCIYANIGSKFSVDGVVFVPITASTCDAIDFDYANMPKNLVIGENVTYRNRNLAVQNIRDHFMEGNDSLLTVNVNNSGPIGSYAFSKCTNLTTANVSAASSIGIYLFSGCKKLTDVVLPSAIISIPNYIFQNCSALLTLNIPETVKYIGSSAFEKSGLNEISLPTELTSIGESAFRNTKLARIDLPNSLTSIGSSAFFNCDLLEEITIPSGISKLNSLTFYGCKRLTSFTIPANIKSVDWACFHDCTALTDLRIDDSDNVLTIERLVSSGDSYNFCPNVETVYIGRSIAKYSSYDKTAFEGNTHLKEVVMSSKVKTLPNGMFQGCTNLENVTVSNQLQAISDNMFSGCSKLTSLNIPSTITSIGSGAFKNCSLLNTFNIPTKVTSVGDNAFNGCAKFTRFNIPAGVTTIAKNTFTGCTALKTLTFANSQNALAFECNVSSLPIDSIYIGRNLTYTYSPFKGTVALRSLTFGDKCTTVGDSLVANCSSLSNIKLNKKIVSIGKSAFQNCSVAQSIDLPETLTTIGDYALAGCKQIQDINISDNISVLPANVVYGCTALKNFKIPAKVCEVSSSLLSTCTNIETISIPDCQTPLKITGSNALFANTKIDSIYIGRDFTTEKSPLYNLKTIRKVVFGNNVKTLQANYFYSCNNLEDLILPKALTSVGNNAFYGCGKIIKIALPKSITTVGANAFDGCSALKYVEIESGQNTLAFNADFDDCALDSIYVGRNLTGNTIPVKGKTSIKSYKTGAYVTSLPENALSGCTSLTDLWLGKRVESLGKNALLNCTAIETIKSYNSTAPVCASGVLSNIDKWGTTLYVPNSALSVYETADQWKDFFFIEGMDVADNSIVTQPTSSSPRVLMAYPDSGEKYLWFKKSGTVYLPINSTSPVLTSSSASVGDFVYCEITLPDGEILYTDTVKIANFADSKTITFMVGDVVYKTELLLAGSSIILPEPPTKEGYTFIGWDNLPETMPNEDVVVKANFKANTYVLTYIVDGEAYKNEKYDCDAKIVPIAAPEKDGRTFVKWDGLVETMPAHNLSVVAVYNSNLCVVYNGNSEAAETVYLSLDAKPSIATTANALVFVDEPIVDYVGENFIMKGVDKNWRANSVVLTDAQPFYSPTDVYCEEISYKRKYDNTKWQALYLPFSLSYDEWKDNMEVAYFNNIHQYDTDGDGEIDRTTLEFFTQNNGELRPNTPYLARALNTGDVTLTGYGKTLAATPKEEGFVDCMSTRYYYKVAGIYQTKYDLYQNNQYAISISKGTFVRPTSSSTTVPPFRIYLDVQNRSGNGAMAKPHRIDIAIDGEVTSIEDVMIDGMDDGNYYDLLGRRVLNHSSGIYIQNGKKVIIK